MVIPRFQSFDFLCTIYVYMLTAIHIKVIIQFKTVKSRPTLITNIHKNNNKWLNGHFGSKQNTLTYHKRFWYPAGLKYSKQVKS